REWDNSIYNLTRKILQQSSESGKTTHELAQELAEARMRELHPIFGHRGRDVIQGIVTRDSVWSRWVDEAAAAAVAEERG
ncbi:hypothetical protein HK405_014861, partial [Cladochytrium tenue]